MARRHARFRRSFARLVRAEGSQATLPAPPAGARRVCSPWNGGPAAVANVGSPPWLVLVAVVDTGLSLRRWLLLLFVLTLVPLNVVAARTPVVVLWDEAGVPIAWYYEVEDVVVALGRPSGLVAGALLARRGAVLDAYRVLMEAVAAMREVPRESIKGHVTNFRILGAPLENGVEGVYLIARLTDIEVRWYGWEDE